jgi:lipopolysaccharide transport protein LptA
MTFLPTRHRALFRIGAATLAFLGAAAAPSLTAANKADDARPPQITFESSFYDTDIKTHVIHLRGDVIITYGNMTVKADRALATAGGDIKDSRWTFDGNVRINAEAHGNLRSDEAVVEFKDDQLKRATATGNPAEFDQKRPDSDIITRGHADEIVYEVGPGTIRLSNDAYIVNGKDDIHAPEITYNLREGRVEAMTSPGTDRVHVTIIPTEGSGKSDGSGSKPKLTSPDPNKTSSATPTPPAAAPAAATPAPNVAAPAGSPSAASQQPPSQSAPPQSAPPK